MKNNVVVVFSSHRPEEENEKFIKHIGETIGVRHKVICYPNFNQFSLPQIYNDAIKEHKIDDCIFVMCHNDIQIKTPKWGKVLLNQFNHSNYSILGVAGSTFVPETGRWWDDRSKMYGIVEHTNGLNTWASEYSNEIRGAQPVVMIDGLFMAFDPDQIIHGFNENYGKFHFYDMPFCIDNYLDGCDIGVITSIRILHQSVGETDPDWENNRKKFVEEYDLPLRHVSEDKLRVLICCQFFKNYTGSELVVFEYAKELKKLGCKVTIISSIVGDPLLSKVNKCGIKAYSLGNAPNYRVGEGSQLVFVKNEEEFDIIHINHKPIGEQILQMYPNTPAVMHIHSEIIPTFEEPIINSLIKKYVSIRQGVTDYIKTYDIAEDHIVEVSNPFDYTRFNTDYKQVKNEKEVVLFIGTLDYLREMPIRDQITATKENNQELWIIGADNGGLASDFASNDHVKYLGVKSNVENYIKQCDYTAGILMGRTTIEGFLCGKRGWIYDVDKQGKILSKKLVDVPDNLEEYRSEFAAKKLIGIYENILEI